MAMSSHLGERECSIQRRHQKVIEERPRPPSRRSCASASATAAVTAARAAGYVVRGRSNSCSTHVGFYFLEMNTRLQVEHPVTEGVTGLDLVPLAV